MKTLSIMFSALVGASSFAAVAPAQQADVFISDVTQDQLLRLSDNDSDGIYHSNNEANSFWNNGSGGATSAAPISAEMRMEGGVAVAYWIDDSADQIYRGVDLNYNGLLEAGTPEVTVFRDSAVLDGASNADGIALTPDGAVWWAGRYDGGSSPMRGIHRMLDLNGDGDANDAGELVTVVPDDGSVMAPSAVTGGLVPVDTENFGRLTEMGNGVVVWSGWSGNFSDDFSVYRFEDFNNDGDVNDAGESINFLNALDKNPNLDRNADFAAGVLRDLATVDQSAVPSGHARFLHLATSVEGGKEVIYVATDSSDTGNFSMNSAGKGVNGLIYRCEDGNLDGDCNDAGETTLFYDGSSTSTIGLNLPKIVGMDALDGSVYVGSLNNDTVIFRIFDNNGDGDALDPNEVDDNNGVGLWDPNTYGSAYGDYPVDYDVAFMNYHVYAVDINVFEHNAWQAPSPGFSTSGVGCALYGTSDLPQITAAGAANLGASDFTVSMRNVPAGVPAALMVGVSTSLWFSSIPLPYDMGNLGYPGCTLYQSWDYTFYATTSGSGMTDGIASLTLPVPNLPSLVGFAIPMQWAVFVPVGSTFLPGLTPLGQVVLQ